MLLLEVVVKETLRQHPPLNRIFLSMIRRKNPIKEGEKIITQLADTKTEPWHLEPCLYYRRGIPAINRQRNEVNICIDFELIHYKQKYAENAIKTS